MGTFNLINGATGVAIYQVLAHIPLSRVCQCQRPDLGHTSLLQIFGCFCISRKRYEVNPRVRVYGRNHYPPFFHAIIFTPFTSPRASPPPLSSLEVFPKEAPGGSVIHILPPSPDIKEWPSTTFLQANESRLEGIGRIQDSGI